VLDLGSAHAQHLARRVRAAGVYSAVRHGDLAPAELARLAPRGVILAGTGAELEPDRVAALRRAVQELAVPVLWSGLAVPPWPASALAPQGLPTEPVQTRLTRTEAGRQG